MNLKQKITIFGSVLGFVAVCEWITDPAQTFPKYSYAEFSALLNQGAIDQNFESITLPTERDMFDRTYVRIQPEGAKFDSIMFVPETFDKTVTPRLRETKAFRYHGCGLLPFSGALFKLFFEIAISSAIFGTYVSRFTRNNNVVGATSK